MKKILTRSEIDTLFSFVESKYVRYKDVQYEIVDHLASAIEEEMEYAENISFEKALNKVYSRFPITGFAMMVQEKEKALKNYFRKTIWKNTFLSLFTFKGILFMSSLLALYLTLSVFGNLGAIIILLTAIIFSVYIVYFVNNIAFNLQKKKEDYLWLRIIFEQSFGVSIFYAICVSQFSSSFLEWNQAMEPVDLWLFFIYLSSWFLGIYQSLFIMPKLITRELTQKYQHLNLQPSD